MFSDVNRATADVLLENGCTVITPRLQACCGSLHAHNGDLDMARELAKANIRALYDLNLDAVIVNAAGCGATREGATRIATVRTRPRSWYRTERRSRSGTVR